MAIYEDFVDEEENISPMEELAPTNDPTTLSNPLKFE
jgi:hypothetical protein